MRKWNIERSIKGLTDEEAIAKLKEKALKAELAFWRKEMLLKYQRKLDSEAKEPQSRALGNFESTEIV